MIGPRRPDPPLVDVQYWLRRPMTLEDAELVRRLRKDQDLTWRGLAREFFVQTEDADLWNGNQLAGMDLHHAAIQLLGEDFD